MAARLNVARFRSSTILARSANVRREAEVDNRAVRRANVGEEHARVQSGLWLVGENQDGVTEADDRGIDVFRPRELDAAVHERRPGGVAQIVDVGAAARREGRRAAERRVRGGDLVLVEVHWPRLYHAAAFLSCLSFAIASTSVCSPSCNALPLASAVSTSRAHPSTTRQRA